MDCVGALTLLTMSIPVLSLIACWVKMEDGGSVLFRQPRVGRGGREFVCLKIRTMPVGTRIVPAHLATSLPVTKVGRLLRRTRLDELPQLWNVLRGEMSLVGPRPCLLGQSDLNSLRERLGVWELRPGLTGLSQVQIQTGMTDSLKAKLDAEYAREISFRVDLTIIFRTILMLARDFIQVPIARRKDSRPQR